MFVQHSTVLDRTFFGVECDGWGIGIAIVCVNGARNAGHEPNMLLLLVPHPP